MPTIPKGSSHSSLPRRAAIRTFPCRRGGRPVRMLSPNTTTTTLQRPSWRRSLAVSTIVRTVAVPPTSIVSEIFGRSPRYSDISKENI